MSLPLSVQRSRPLDSLQRVAACFKHFETKLDKLQADVSQHGQILNDLRLLMTNLTGNSIAPEIKRYEENRRKKKSTAIQYEGATLFESKKPRRKPAQVISKVKSRSYPFHNESRHRENDAAIGLNKYSSSPTGLTVKTSPRSRKVESPRKTKLIRGQYVIEKKRTKNVST